MNESQNQGNSLTSLNINEFIGIIRKRKNIIILITIICGVFALFKSVFITTPQYSSSTNILVNQKSSNNANDPNNVNQGQMQAAVQMINTYKDIITSPAILDEVADKIQNDGYTDNAGAIKGMIGLSNEQNSQVFTVTVKCDDPNKAAVIANTTAQVFKKKIKAIMSVNNVSILSKAQVNPNPISPNVTKNTFLGILFGIILGILVAFILNALDRTVVNESFITDELGLNELGIISEIPASKVKKLIVHSSRGLGRTENRKRRV